MNYANDGWGPDNIDRVFAHETGHVFNAPDEYAKSGCDCGGEWGYFGTPNLNCANCADGGSVACIMRSNSWAMCKFTPGHYGWGAFATGIDAALWRRSVGKIYLFSDDYYVRFSSVSAGVDPGYPRKIEGNWPGLPASFNTGIDAALMNDGNGRIYFFKGERYVRFSKVSGGVDPGYPKPIKGNWPGLPAEFQQGIDAALWRKSNGRIYFFKGTQYVRFSAGGAKVDAAYPKPIKGNWPGLPGNFNGGIDSVLMRWSNGKIYFFKDREYVRYSSVGHGVDPGYPALINGSWLPFPE